MPPRSGGLLTEEEEEKERKSFDEIRSAEQKLRGMKDRRGDLLATARRLGEEAMDLQARRGPLYDGVEEAHAKFRDLGHKQSEVRHERDKLRARIEEILSVLKHNKSSHPSPDRPRPDQIAREIALLERRQQTTVMDVKEENELIKRMRQLRGTLTEAEKADVAWKAVDETAQGLREELGKARHRVEDLSKTIDDIRVQRDALMAKVKTDLQEAGHLVAEIRAKGKARSEVLDKVGEVSKQIDEAESSVMGLRRESFARRDEARQTLRDHNQSIRNTFRGSDVIERHAEANLQALLKKGKIELRG